jgi:hypothetical protein
MPSKAVRTAETKRKTRLYLALAALTLIILLVTLATAGKERTLRCVRLESGEVDCVARESILGIVTLSEKRIAGAAAVSMGEQCVDINCYYRLEVYATQGLVPVTEKYSSNFDQLVAIKDQVNEFFTDKTSASVQVKEETSVAMIAAVVLVAVLIWAYLGYLIWQVQHPKSEDGDPGN